jgi:hypothetical protein
VLEVGVPEVGRVFEAVAEEAVEHYVGCPDECDRGGELPVSDVADEEESEREGEGVGEVVDCGAEADVDEVAEHEEVGCEEKDGEEAPTVVEMVVGEEGGDEDGSFFAEEGGGAGQHHGLYGIVGGSFTKLGQFREQIPSLRYGMTSKKVTDKSRFSACGER